MHALALWSYSCTHAYACIYTQMPAGVPASFLPIPATKPDYPGPHSFLVLAVVVTIICAIFNLLSLACGLPAVIYAGLVSLTLNCY